MEFPYFEKDNQYFPVIDVILQGSNRSRMFKGLIDSGASFSIFRTEVADLLGIKIEKGKRIHLVGVGGRILGYLHNLKVSIDGKNFFDCKVVFSPEYTASFNLLGRDNFFHPFSITFNEKSRKLLIEKN